jgi:hypothetical protein
MPIRFQPQVQLPPDPLVYQFLEPMRAVVLTWLTVAQVLPIEITSWWRDEARNAAAGGNPGSQHLIGTAIDGLSPGMNRTQLLAFVEPAARYFGVTAPAEGSSTSGRRVHVQGLPAGMTAQLLKANPNLLRTAESFVGPPQPPPRSI